MGADRHAFPSLDVIVRSPFLISTPGLRLLMGTQFGLLPESAPPE